MARTIFMELQRQLAEMAENAALRLVVPPGVQVDRVRVTETSTTWAEYFA
jgi:6-pyruvoyltetrahydropterin/6-carboxytetrahydropterin synthase